MSDRFFLDTNIFIYAVDTSEAEREKAEQARHIVRGVIENECGVISIQVLQAFYNIATKRIAIPLSSDEALQYIRYLQVLEIVEPTFEMVVSAILLNKQYMLSFWDSMIVQAALTTNCTHLLSEDMQDGQRFGELIIQNPLKRTP